MRHEQPAAFPIPKEQLQNPEDLGPMIESILNATYVYGISDDDIALGESTWIGAGLDQNKEIFDKAFARYTELKPERNALTAILISKIWNDPAFIQEREALVELAKTSGDAVLERGERLFTNAILDAYDTRDKNTDPVLTTVWQKFGKHIDFIESFRSDESPATHIIRGVVTATRTAVNLPKIIDLKMQQEHLKMSKEQRLATIQRAYRNIGVVLASMNSQTAVPLMEKLWKTPDLFSLKKTEDGKGYLLTLDGKKLTGLKKEKSDEPLLKERHSSPTTRCPAMLRVGASPSVIAEYFQWSLDMLSASNSEGVSF